MRLINIRPSRPLVIMLAMLPFILVVLAYVVGSDIRRAENPRDKLLPAPASVIERASDLATEPDRRSKTVLLWADTGASLRRPAVGSADWSTAGKVHATAGGIQAERERHPPPIGG